MAFSLEGGEHTSTGTRTVTDDDTRMARNGFSVQSTTAMSKPVPPFASLGRYNNTRAANLLSQD